MIYEQEECVRHQENLSNCGAHCLPYLLPHVVSLDCSRPFEYLLSQPLSIRSWHRHTQAHASSLDGKTSVRLEKFDALRDLKDLGDGLEKKEYVIRNAPGS